MITGAQAVVECLRREGVAHVFGIPGTMNLPILDVLRDTPDVRFILTRHEQGAAFMAYGYARALNRPAVVTATEGPGVTNLATGIGAAYKGYVPVISISGAQEIWLRERDASQDIDQVTFHLPITKWAYSIPTASKLQEALRRAFRVALAEPIGPVHLDVSKEILLDKTAAEPIAPLMPLFKLNIAADTPAWATARTRMSSRSCRCSFLPLTAMVSTTEAMPAITVVRMTVAASALPLFDCRFVGRA